MLTRGSAQRQLSCAIFSKIVRFPLCFSFLHCRFARAKHFACRSRLVLLNSHSYFSFRGFSSAATLPAPAALAQRLPSNNRTSDPISWILARTPHRTPRIPLIKVEQRLPACVDEERKPRRRYSTRPGVSITVQTQKRIIWEFLLNCKDFLSLPGKM